MKRQAIYLRIDTSEPTKPITVFLPVSVFASEPASFETVMAIREEIITCLRDALDDLAAAKLPVVSS